MDNKYLFPVEHILYVKLWINQENGDQINEMVGNHMFRLSALHIADHDIAHSSLLKDYIFSIHSEKTSLSIDSQ